MKAVWREVEGLKKEGLAKTIGVSNFQVKHLEEIVHGAEIIPAINQVLALLSLPVTWTLIVSFTVA